MRCCCRVARGCTAAVVVGIVAAVVGCTAAVFAGATHDPAVVVVAAELPPAVV